MGVSVPRVFVYGTLMRGECRHHYIERARPRSIRTTIAGGRLFDFGEYPGLVFDSRGAGRRVRGELIAFEEIEPVLAVLDRVEGVSPVPSPEDEYRRVVAEVEIPGDGPADAWIYIANRVPPGARPIRSGNWRLWRKSAGPR
jgi:gamma-glutamylcyclotransferase (GGCT)/AIG2-like uncharacterized protein YtfP